MTTCRDIGPNPSARFQSLAAAYAGLHVRPGGGDTGLEPPTTFVDGTPDWARYQQGRSFNLSAFNDEARRCLIAAFGYSETSATTGAPLPSLHQDLRGTLAMIDYFRRNFDANNPTAGGNRANPADSNGPNDRGDANVITQYEIEQFVWETVRGAPEDVRWDQMRDQGDGTLRRLHAVLGIIHYLGTEPPATASPQTPAPEASGGEVSWWSRHWEGAIGGTAAAAVLVTGIAALLRIRSLRAETAEARVETQRIEGELPAVRERLREVSEQVSALEAQRAMTLEALRPVVPAEVAVLTPRVEALRQRLETARRELSAAQRELDRFSQNGTKGRRRLSSSQLREHEAARARRDAALADYSRIERDLRAQESALGVGRAFELLGSRPASN